MTVAARSGWPRYYTVVLLLFAAVFISYIDRSNISVAAIAMGISPLIMTAIFAFFTRESTPIYAPGMPFVAAAAMMVLALAILWAYRPRGAVVPPAEAAGRPPGAA